MDEWGEPVRSAPDVAALTGDTRELVDLAMSGRITMAAAARAAIVVRSRRDGVAQSRRDGAVIAAARAAGMPDARRPAAQPPRRRFARTRRRVACRDDALPTGSPVPLAGTELPLDSVAI
jgi:hypothetical protein